MSVVRGPAKNESWAAPRSCRTHIFYILNSNYHFRVCFLPRSSIVLGCDGTKRRGSRRWLCHSVDRSTLGLGYMMDLFGVHHTSRILFKNLSRSYSSCRWWISRIKKMWRMVCGLFPRDIAIWSVEGGDYSARASDSWSFYPGLPITYNDVTLYSDNFLRKSFI